MVIEQQVDGEIDAQVGRGVWQGGAGVLWSVGGGVYYHVGDSKRSRPPPKRMNFRKSSEGGGGSFSIQKFIAIIDDTSVMNFGKRLQYDFSKMRGGGGQRPFGTFPKIHPFWRR